MGTLVPFAGATLAPCTYSLGGSLYVFLGRLSYLVVFLERCVVVFLERCVVLAWCLRFIGA